MQQLDPSVKTLWSLRLLLLTLLLTALVFAWEFFMTPGGGDQFLPFATGVWTAIVLTAGLLLSFILPSLRYKAWSYELREGEVHVRRGVLTRIYTVAPTTRIQHLDVAQSLTERMFGLGRLVIYTAGTRGADIVIPGLPLDYAQALRDYLKNLTVEDAV